MYALVDCNTFYASCELIFRPDLWNKPVVVLSNNDGCIISCNAEAKALGIPNFVPFFEVRNKIQYHHIAIFSSNYEFYGDISSRVMTWLSDWGARREIYSIDEAFLELDHCDYLAHGKALKNQLFQSIGMPVCVGTAPTKTLAKLANRAAKKISSLHGICVLDKPHKWEWLLARCQTSDIWGVGERIGKRLANRGIHTALDLARADQKTLRREFSVVIERTMRELNGHPCLEMELIPPAKQEVVCTRSFSYKITELGELQQAISRYAHRACEKMRRQNGFTESFWVYLESFDKKIGYYNEQKLVKLPHLSNDTRLIASLAAKAITKIYVKGIRYKKCGIGLLDIRTRNGEQEDLFTDRQSSSSDAMMSVLDSINRRFGRQTIETASTGINPKWVMKREQLSLAYTTRWNDLPPVRCY